MKFKGIIIAMTLASVALIAGCNNVNLPGLGSGSNTLKAASAKNTDSKISVEMLKQLIEDKTDHNVEIVKDLPASTQIFQGLDQGEFDFANLFSGEVYNNYFDDIEYTTDPDKTLKEAQERFGDKYDIKWYDPLGYTNNYSIAVKQSFAEKNHVKTVSDLKSYASSLSLGTDNAWIERDNDGYKGFKKTYGFKFENAKGMDASLMYQSIGQDELDVVTAYTVDPQLKKYGLQVLKDDKQYFPPYQGSLVARNEVLDENPEINDILKTLEGKVSTSDMQDLMYQVDLKKRNIEKVTRSFLKDKELLDH